MTQEVQEANPYGSRDAVNMDGNVGSGDSADSLFVPPKREDKPQESGDASEQQHDWKKRYDGVRPEIDRLANENKALKEKLESLSKRTEEPTTEPQNQLNTQETTATPSDDRDLEKRLAELEAERSLAIIKRKHPDMEQITSSDEFYDWVKTKSKRVQESVYKNPNDPQAAIETLDLYKYESELKSKSESDTEGNLTAGADSMVSTRNVTGDSYQQKKVWTVSEINNLVKQGGQALERHIDEINAAQKEGRIAPG